MRNDFESNYLMHHGILGQRWGKKNGPPYPLDAPDHSPSEKKAGYKKSIGGGRNEDQYNRKSNKSTSNQKSGKQEKERFHLSDTQKKAIKIGAAAAATALVAYGGYKLATDPRARSLISKGLAGKNSNQRIAELAKQIDNVGPEIVKKTNLIDGIKPLNAKESLSDTLSKANPYRGTIEGKNNCVPSAIAGYLRQHGYDVTARSTNGVMQNTGGVVEECFKNAKVFDGSAVKFGRSKADAEEMLIKRFGNNAEGLVAVDLKNGSVTGGHCFSWSIQDGVVKFRDFNTGRDDSSVSNYWRIIDPNGQLTVAKLEVDGMNIEALKKYLNF